MANFFNKRIINKQNFNTEDIDEEPPSNKGFLHLNTSPVPSVGMASKQIGRCWTVWTNVANLRHIHRIGLGGCGLRYLDICPKVIDESTTATIQGMGGKL